MKKLTITLLSIFVASSVLSQTPQKLSYQSVVRNSDNELIINQEVGFRISILKGSTTGDVVYIEVLTPITNANGLISIQFGGGSVFESIDWGTDTYFIRTQIDPLGGANYTIEGVSELLSVPYALHAETAENSINASPLEIIASNNYESTTQAGGIWQESIVLTKSCLLTINAYASGVSIEGPDSGVAVIISLDNEIKTIDRNFIVVPGGGGSWTYHASTSTTLYLEPGTYELKIERTEAHIFSDRLLKANYFAIYAK